MVEVVVDRLTGREVDMETEEVYLKLKGKNPFVERYSDLQDNMVAEEVINQVDQLCSFEQKGLVRPARRIFFLVQTWFMFFIRILSWLS